MPDEVGADLISLAGHHDVFAAPMLLWAEIRNILVVAERCGRISRERVDQAIETIGDLGIVLDTALSSAGVLSLCRTHQLAERHLAPDRRVAAGVRPLAAPRSLGPQIRLHLGRRRLPAGPHGGPG